MSGEYDIMRAYREAIEIIKSVETDYLPYEVQDLAIECIERCMKIDTNINSN